jgi:hypothetical protein
MSGMQRSLKECQPIATELDGLEELKKLLLLLPPQAGYDRSCFTCVQEGLTD